MYLTSGLYAPDWSVEWHFEHILYIENFTLKITIININILFNFIEILIRQLLSVLNAFIKFKQNQFSVEKPT